MSQILNSYNMKVVFMSFEDYYFYAIDKGHLRM